MMGKGYVPVKFITGVKTCYTERKDKTMDVSYQFSFDIKPIVLDQKLINEYEKINKNIENAFLLKDGEERKLIIDKTLLYYYPLSNNYSWLLEYASQDTKDYIAYIHELESRPFLQDDNTKVLR